ncbi:hypothetical protein ACF0H5_010980 [Mactra antiquata]
MIMDDKRTFTLCCLVLCFAVKDVNGHYGRPGQQLNLSTNSGGAFSGQDLAATYCAYCRQRNWIQCVERFCFGRNVALSGRTINNIAGSYGSSIYQQYGIPKSGAIAWRNYYLPLNAGLYSNRRRYL